MKPIFLINAGSSSMKWQLIEMPSEHVVANGQVERLNLPGSIVKVNVRGKKTTETVEKLDEVTAIDRILERLTRLHIVESLNDIQAVGHRVVAGGTVFHASVELTPDRIEQLRELSELAPLHNPLEVKCIDLLAEKLPQVTQYAVFDSTYFADLPEKTAIYGIPYDWTKDFQIRRYGEHGISHRYLAQQAAEMLQKPLAETNVITMHLGSGASITAVQNGKPFDTSMGLTPVTGMLMGTRSGDVDPSLIPYLMKRLGFRTPEEVLLKLNQASGLLGVSGVSSDMRDLHAAAGDNERARLALDMFVNQAVKLVGAYYTEIGGADALVFAGGIGEKDEVIRAAIIERLGVLSIKMDATLNQAGATGDLGTTDSAARVLLIPTDEELAMAREVQALID
ncbi:acetate kinase [Secundilactobacillus paracollinoides]|uniref:Acetate kinase n=1 Tax=Secundilactobacillus paracollinoides TaxID=240427 RepID=A0A1B2IYC2_9LACO|nr:acetate kinase [Secundilactobacillus paracollinoides]ANZ64463.1 acetate kinase [Secundilactobacillus paracollinoides]ANZ67064.1 acetate kinase [Secundilactobacillus paracollinoides]